MPLPELKIVREESLHSTIGRFIEEGDHLIADIDEMKDLICKMIKSGFMFAMDRDRLRDAIEDFTFMCQPDDDLNKDRIFKSLEYEDEEDSDDEMNPSFAHVRPPCVQESGPTCEEIRESA